MFEDKVYHEIMDAIITEEGDPGIKDIVLRESKRTEILGQLDDNKEIMNYLFLFEEFLDQHDIYMFEGWKDAKFIGKPIAGRFWFKVYILVDSKTDLEGAKRIKDANPESEIKIKTRHDGTRLLSFEIKRNLLDDIQKNNNDKIENLSDASLEEMM